MLSNWQLKLFRKIPKYGIFCSTYPVLCESSIHIGVCDSVSNWLLRFEEERNGKEKFPFSVDLHKLVAKHVLMKRSVV